MITATKNLRRWSTALLQAATVAALLTGADRASSQDYGWEWSTNRVAASIVVERRSELSPSLVREVREAALLRAQQVLGQGVSVEFVNLTPLEAERLRGARDDRAWFDLRQAAAAAGHDLHWTIVLRKTAEGFEAVAAQRDVDLATTGAVVRRTTTHRDLLPAVAAEAMVDAFRPTTRIVELRQSRAVMKVRGGMLIPSATLVQLVQPGDAYLPVIRRRGTDGDLEAGKSVPWTLLAVDSIDAATIQATVVSGLRNPLGGRNRSRSEQWAVAAGKPTGSTIIEIVGQREKTPLVGCRLYASAQGQTHLIGTTDARGRVVVPAMGSRTQSIVVTTKYLPLAKFPLVPGLTAQLNVPVPGNARIIDTEHWLADWQAEFTDLFIHRRVLATLASARIEQGNLASAQSLLESLDRAGSPRRLVETLEARRRTTTVEGPVESRLVARLFDDSQNVATQLDDATTIHEIRSRLSAAQKTGTGATP